MDLQLRPSSRRQVKMKMALAGPSGSGKTYSSLLLAKGLCNNWNKICIIDTENRSADLYAHLGDFNVISLAAPYSPEKYQSALELCQEQGMEVVIIDSISHCWEFLLDAHSKMVGNSFTNWSKITPRHNQFVQTMLQGDFHVIATMRTKTDYVLNQKDGKYVPEKMGLKTIQRDGVDYEFTLVFDLDIKHNATASKDRTNLFIDKPSSVLSQDTGAQIKRWTQQGEHLDLFQRINACKSLPELIKLYNSNPNPQYQQQFTLRKQELSEQKHLLNGKT